MIGSDLHSIALWVYKIVYGICRGVTSGTLRMSLRTFNINDYRGRLLLNIFGHNFRLISLSYHNGDRDGDYKSALKLLEITAECEEAEIRKAYLDKAKVYHPDSLSDSADPKQFAKVMFSTEFYLLATH